MSTELLVGIILIALGILLAAAAYMVLSSRKGDQPEEGEPADGMDMDAGGEDAPDLAQDDITTEDELAEDAGVAEAEDDDRTHHAGDVETDEIESSPDDIHEPEPELEDAGDVEAAIEQEPAAAPVDETPEPFIPEPEIGPRIQVATLLRDEVSGQLIVQVGEKEYRSADELRDSGDWTRVEFAASDLSKWIDEPVERPVMDRDSNGTDRVKPLSMIEQINQILQEKIETSGDDHLAVRLIEGAEGTARVLIGVHSYELGEVPDETISNLIREAVAEWESSS